MSESYCDAIQRRSVAIPPPFQVCNAEGKFLFTIVNASVGGLVIALATGVLRTPGFLQKIANNSEIFNRRWFVIGTQVGGALGLLQGIGQGVKVHLDSNNITDLMGNPIQIAYDPDPLVRWKEDLPKVLGCMAVCASIQLVFSLTFHALMKRLNFITGFWSFSAGSGTAATITSSTLMLLITLWPPKQERDHGGGGGLGDT